ncbi:hypothetical protein [Plantactinospora sp. DSM 117369]
MAYRTWGRVLLAALLVGIVSGAGQLGIAYGLGLVRFDRGFDAATANQWPAQLVWVGWFAMVAAVLGATLADRLARRYTLPTTLGNRAAISALAALGALAVAPLSMQPARAAQVASADPVTLAGVAAALGAGVGFLAALAALSQRPLVWNIAAVTGTVWFLAVLSVLPSLGPTDPLPAVRLGGVDPSWLSAGTSQRLAVVTMPALALVAGALTGALARWRELSVPVVASCGVAGPLMLALAYVVAGRGDSADAYQAAPYWGALISVGAGALGSVLAAWARWPLTTTAPEETAEAGSSAEADPSATATTPGGTAGTMPGDTGTAGTTPAGSGTTPASSGASDAPTVIIPAANPTAGGATTGTAAPGGATAGGTSAGRTWRLEIPSGEPRTGGTGASGDRLTGTAPAGTWPPSSAVDGRTVGESAEPSREPAPSSGNWSFDIGSFDIGSGIPTPRVPTEDSAPTERFGASAPTVPESGQQSATEPVSPGSGGPATDSGDAGFPAGWAGAGRLRTEDFWPTTTPPATTPGASATPAATTPAAPESPAAPPPTVSTPPTAPAPSAATPPPSPVTPNRSDEDWDAFASVSRPRLDRREPSTDPAHRPADDGAAGTTGRSTTSLNASSPGSSGVGSSHLSGFIAGPPGESTGRAGDNRSYPSEPTATPGRTPAGPGGIRATPGRDSVGSGGAAAGLPEPGWSRTEPSGADPDRTERIPPVPVVSGDSPVRPASERGARPADPVPETTAEVTPEPEPEPATGDAERPTGRIRRGLFRRNRGNADPEQTDIVETGKSGSTQDKSESTQDKSESKRREAKGRNRSEEPVPARDEEYVDWVSGLSEPDPTADDLGLDRSVRRSLRSTGRHHAD